MTRRWLIFVVALLGLVAADPAHAAKQARAAAPAKAPSAALAQADAPAHTPAINPRPASTERLIPDQ